MTPGRTFQDEHVYLPSLAVTGPALEGYRFTNCVISGPAMVALLGTPTITGVTFDLGNMPPEAMFVEVPEGRALLGVIGLVDVTIEACVMRQIAFVGPQSTIDQIRVSLLGL